MLEVIKNGIEPNFTGSENGYVKSCFWKETEWWTFSDDEMVRLKMTLRELYSDLDGVVDIDFNYMLKSII